MRKGIVRAVLSVPILALAACGGADTNSAAPDAPAVASAPDPGNGAVPAPQPGEPAQAPAPPAESVSACLMQGKDQLHVTPLRAVGTEPFWGARIEGRCVTYSHPEDPKGTRIWTRYTKEADGESWSGALGGRRFELRIRAAPGCSDGMSDTTYPLAADLIVNGERRTGCAEPR